LRGQHFAVDRVGREILAPRPPGAGGPGGSISHMQTVKFEEALEQILQRDQRYHRAAYSFVQEALNYTQKKVAASGKEEPRHVRGQELLRGLRAYALQEFGPMALTVFHEWGVRACEDFGEIVFNMVESNFLKKTDEDSRADFKGGYDFQEAFVQPFLPARKISQPEPEPKPTEP